MKASLRLKSTPLLAGASAVLVLPVHADTFGTGPNTFTIDFVHVGNAGNADDAGAGGGIYSSPYGGVNYSFRMGTTEVPQDWITKATHLGMTSVTTGSWAGMRPADNMSWYEVAAFVNWLNTSTGHQAAYDLTWAGGTWTMNLWSSSEAWDNEPGTGVDLNLYRHKEAFYFLPSEDEWYKAAYHKNDGATANYWDYATGTNSIPDGVDFVGDNVFDAVFAQGGINPEPNPVGDVGAPSAYGTYGQSGNIWEWNESAFDGSGDSPTENHGFRGGIWYDAEDTLRASTRYSGGVPSLTGFQIGFRVASVPEPSAAMMVLGPGLLWLARRRRGSSL